LVLMQIPVMSGVKYDGAMLLDTGKDNQQKGQP